MIISQNPASEEVFINFNELTLAEIEDKLVLSQKTFESWKKTDLVTRKKLISSLGALLKSKDRELGKLITLEMGKPISESYDEISKCALACEYYANNIDAILANEYIKTEASESYVSFEPLGIVFAVMPWNFPFWQVLRFAVPAVMAGNAVILKHASNVPQCALALEELFLEAGFSAGTFQTLLISSNQVEDIIKDFRVKAVTLTGSERAGSSVASIAAKEIKKSVLELGGSDPFIVLADADLEYTTEMAVYSRFHNTGQACNAAKRFIIIKEVADQFIKTFVEKVSKIKLGDPMDEATELGPLASEKVLLDLERQVHESIAKGAELLLGGKRVNVKGYYFEPTILNNVKKGMAAFDEEVFGPVAAITVVNNLEEATQAANDSSFGLGASIWTKDIKLAKRLTTQIESGAVFINTPAASDRRMPFGGIKHSGFGRELGVYGIREFINIKSVWIK